MKKQRIAAAVYIFKKNQEHEKKKRSRSCWVKPWIARRNQLGAHSTLMMELENEDPIQLRLFLRMSSSDLEFILNKVGPRISKQVTQMRQPISAKEKLCLTLRFLASGDSYSSLSYLFRIPKCTISLFVPDICSAIFDCLKEEFLNVPLNSADWKKIADDFEKHWQFPHCIGSLDGKHVTLQAPKHSGSCFFNYKKHFSIVLLAVADANYKFIYIDAGCNGRISDGGVFARSSLAMKLNRDQLAIPEREALQPGGDTLPFVFVADDAFPLKENIMKPFPRGNPTAAHRVFNYRLSRARRIVENSFGIMSQVFQIFRRPILLQPDKAELIVLASCVLHNYLMTKSASTYAPSGTFDHDDHHGNITNGTWRQEQHQLSFQSFSQQGSNSRTQTAAEIRNTFMNYFMSPEGEVQWQYKYI